MAVPLFPKARTPEEHERDDEGSSKGVLDSTLAKLHNDTQLLTLISTAQALARNAMISITRIGHLHYRLHSVSLDFQMRINDMQRASMAFFQMVRHMSDRMKLLRSVFFPGENILPLLASMGKAPQTREEQRKVVELIEEVQIPSVSHT